MHVRVEIKRAHYSRPTSFCSGYGCPLPDLKPLLSELRKTIHTDGLLLSQYTYTQRTTDGTRLEKQAKKKEVKAFQVFPGSSEHVAYRRQIEKDGRPLTPEEAKKEEQALQKRIAEAQLRRARITPAERDRRVDTVLSFSDLNDPERD